MATKDALVQALQEIIAPLIEADGGELYLVFHENDEVKLHLAGTCSGCPGAALTSRGVISPTLRSLNPQLRVVVTTGYLIPSGAERIQAAERMA
ncbi:MAG: NifU family protein [Polyangiaceae bacterium]|jgi:Fe-S cluster biogenesis protein NfuA|nr:NifU family protein [Polyangiaceae bacterium]